MRRLFIITSIVLLAISSHADAASRFQPASTHVVVKWSTMNPGYKNSGHLYTVSVQGGALHYEAAYRTLSGSTGVNTALQVPVSAIGCTQSLDNGKTLRIYSNKPHGIRYMDEGQTTNRNWVDIADLPAAARKALLKYGPIAAKLNACKDEVDLYHLRFIDPPSTAREILTYGYSYKMFGQSYTNQTRISTDGTLLFDDNDDTQPAMGRTIVELPLAKISCISKSYSSGDTHRLLDAPYIRINVADDLDALERSYVFDTLSTTTGVTLTAVNDEDLDSLLARLEQASPIIAEKLRPSCAR